MSGNCSCDNYQEVLNGVVNLKYCVYYIASERLSKTITYLLIWQLWEFIKPKAASSETWNRKQARKDGKFT